MTSCIEHQKTGQVRTWSNQFDHNEIINKLGLGSIKKTSNQVENILNIRWHCIKYKPPG